MLPTSKETVEMWLAPISQMIAGSETSGSPLCILLQEKITLNSSIELKVPLLMRSTLSRPILTSHFAPRPFSAFMSFQRQIMRVTLTRTTARTRLLFCVVLHNQGVDGIELFGMGLRVVIFFLREPAMPKPELNM